ncbi:MAG: hypothetical protein LC792_02490 [Actinobacteria bacterium]|nr:hypothetical protein [Actinomycetota bacterium]
MTGTARLQRLMLLVGAVTVLLASGTGVGHAGDSERLWGSTGPAVTAGGTIGSGASGTLDPRLQRDVGAGSGHHCCRHDDVLSGPPVLGQQRRLALDALAAVLERAGHPERVGHVLLRGPPGSSA